MASLIGIESTRSDGGWVPWSLLGVWLAAVVLVVPAAAEEFSLSRCLASGVGQIDHARHFACFEAQREYEVRRYKEEAAERERQRRAAEEATRQQAEAQAQETADQAARARQEAERARKAEEVERARKAEAAEAVERARKAAEEVDAARRTEALQQAQRRRAAEQFMPGMCPLPDLTARCAMPQDPVLEQIRRSQENAARGRLSR
jgi:hypothetical protein